MYGARRALLSRDPATAFKIAQMAVASGRRARTGPTPYHLREACYNEVPECSLFKGSLAA